MFDDEPVPVEYGGFGIRLGAGLIDGLVALPLALGFGWLVGTSMFHPIAGSIFDLLIVLSFEVALVARYGGSPGKLALGLRIRDVSLGRITARQAAMRALPNLAVAVLKIAAGIAVVQRLGPALNELSGLALGDAVKAATPAWATVLNLIGGCWFLAEFISMMTNEQRRALHDKIADTIVVVASSVPEPAAVSD